VLDKAGDERAHTRIASSPEQLPKLVERLTADGSAMQVVLEASGCFL